MLTWFMASDHRFRSQNKKASKIDFGNSSKNGKITALGSGSGGGRAYPFDIVLKRLLAACILGYIQKPLNHADCRLPWFLSVSFLFQYTINLMFIQLMSF